MLPEFWIERGDSDPSHESCPNPLLHVGRKSLELGEGEALATDWYSILSAGSVLPSLVAYDS
jgi:hypothetical protein